MEPISAERSIELVQDRLRKLRPSGGSSPSAQARNELRQMVKSMSPTSTHRMIQENMLIDKSSSSKVEKKNRRNNAAYKSLQVSPRIYHVQSKINLLDCETRQEAEIKENFQAHGKPLKPHVMRTRALNETLNMIESEEKKEKSMKKINDLGKFMVEEL